MWCRGAVVDIVICLVVASISVIRAESVAAQCVLNETHKLTASDAEFVDHFGYNVAIDGDLAVVAAPQNEDTGSAYVFRWDGAEWVEEAKLAGSDDHQDALWGMSVGVSGDVMVLGTPNDDERGAFAGAAFVYRFDGADWIEEAKLTASDGVEFERFGCAVAISGDAIVVGSLQAGDPWIGAAYVYRFDGASWSQEQKLTASDGQIADHFGESVDVQGGVAVIGAPGVTGFSESHTPGAVYVYRFDGAAWNEEAKLTAADGVEDDRLGASVSLNGDADLVLAAADSAGAAYVFRLDGAEWTEEAKLTSADDEEFAMFGAVALDGDTAIVGAPMSEIDGVQCGAAYLFRFDGSNWLEDETLAPSDSPEGAFFGGAIALDADRAIIGAQWDDSEEVQAGSAYVVDTAVVDCNTNGVHDPCDIQQGLSQDCNANDQPDECDELPPPSEVVKLMASDAAPYDYFGWSVSISGDVAVVGAEWINEAGAAYVFRFNGDEWVEEAKLTGADSVWYDWFGFSVAVSGDVIVVGAYGNNDDGGDSGSAYVFRFDGSQWNEEVKLIASDASANAAFGRAVAIQGGVMLIGAPYDNGEVSFGGAAYVFRFDGTDWVEEAKLVPSDVEYHDEFGYSVAIDGDTAIAGAHYEDEVAGGAGAAYVFRSDGTGNWNEEAKLTAPDGVAFDYLGSSVAVHDGVAVAGAIRGTVNNEAKGAAYVYRFDGATWPFEQKLIASDGAVLNWFGCSLSMLPDTILIGAYENDNDGVRTGSAYVFRYGGAAWYEDAKLIPWDGEWGDQFGFSVALDDGGAIVGARYENEAGTQAGAAYVFGIPLPPDCGSALLGDMNCDGVVDSLDVDAFVLALLDPAAYAATYSDCYLLNGDMNGDGSVDGDDVQLFIDLEIGS